MSNPNSVKRDTMKCRCGGSILILTAALFICLWIYALKTGNIYSYKREKNVSKGNLHNAKKSKGVDMDPGDSLLVKKEYKSLLAENKNLRSQLGKCVHGIRDNKVKLQSHVQRLMIIEDAQRKYLEAMQHNEEKFGMLEKKLDDLQGKVLLIAKNETQHNQKICHLENSCKENTDDIKKTKENLTQHSHMISLLEKSSRENADDMKKVVENVTIHDQKISLLEESSRKNADGMKKVEENVTQHRNDIDFVTQANKENNNLIIDTKTTFKMVDVLLLIVIVILLIYITHVCTWQCNKREQGRRNVQCEDHPAIISFNPACLNTYKLLADAFLPKDYRVVEINTSKDIPKLRFKVVFLFVDFHERNIILEDDSETSRIKRETVDAILKFGGTPVVIYCRHSKSRNLEDGALYLDKLTSANLHSTLRKLSKRGCFLSIDSEFSEYQKNHLEKLCKTPPKIE